VNDSMPYKSHKDKKSVSRLNLAGEKSGNGKGPVSIKCDGEYSECSYCSYKGLHVSML
jgi:hypothetical protein